jgi:hypothetical protein
VISSEDALFDENAFCFNRHILKSKRRWALARLDVERELAAMSRRYLPVVIMQGNPGDLSSIPVPIAVHFSILSYLILILYSLTPISNIMKSISILIGLAATSIAQPVVKRAVFAQSTYNDLSISGGIAGNAQQEALQKLGGLPTDLSTVEKSDLDFLDSVNQIANDAETDAFNPAIEAASGEEADALQVSFAVS